MNKRAQAGLAISIGFGAALAARALLQKRRHIDFLGKTVLITGGSRGLGLVMARAFAAEGARIALCARDKDELEQAAVELDDRGAEVFTVVCDMSEEREITRLIKKVQDHYGFIDILINNAGVIEVGPMETMTIADYEEAMRVHFWAPLHASLAVLPSMKNRKEGRIVNISSIGGKVSVPHLLPYCASKFALVGLSEGLRAELLKYGIYVTTVCPGLMRTGSHLNAKFKGWNRAEYALFTVMDAAPFSSMNVENAASQILEACRRGDAEVLLSVPAKILGTFHALYPGLTSDLLGLAAKLLPGVGGIGSNYESGSKSQSWVSPSLLTASIEGAAMRNNEKSSK